MANTRSQFQSTAQAAEPANSFLIITCAVITRTTNQNLTESIRPSRAFETCGRVCSPSGTQVGEGPLITPPQLRCIYVGFALAVCPQALPFVIHHSSFLLKNRMQRYKKINNLYRIYIFFYIFCFIYVVGILIQEHMN